jgi:hypothetical protein
MIGPLPGHELLDPLYHIDSQQWRYHLKTHSESQITKELVQKKRIDHKKQIAHWHCGRSAILLMVGSSEVTDYGGGSTFVRRHSHHGRFLIVFPTNQCFAPYLSNNSIPSQCFTLIFH